jgi:enoyl-CoA hydratase/carnithine racemase
VHHHRKLHHNLHDGDGFGSAAQPVSRVDWAEARRCHDESMYDEILYEVNDPVAVITLNRPDSLNAWTDAMGGEIDDAMQRAAADKSVVGIVVTGAGRAFCAGADMNLLSGIAARGDGGGVAATPERVRPQEAEPGDTAGDFAGRFPYLMTIDKPIIAAVNGAVAGMAYPFALCCDLRVVTTDALFLTAFAQRGLIAEWGLSWVLPRLVGPGVALDLLLSSRRVKGEEALALGLANYLVQPDELLDFCRNYIVDLATKCSPSSMAVMKRQVYEQLHAGLGPAERDAQRLMLASFGRPDFNEGVRSFIEKRPPQFPRIGD